MHMLAISIWHNIQTVLIPGAKGQNIAGQIEKGKITELGLKFS